MRVMVLVKASKDSEAGMMPSQQLLTDMGNFNEQLIKAGVLLAGEGLHPSSRGARVRFSGKDRTVIDGPFSETKELLAGYWIWQVKSMEEAIEWVKRCPNPMEGESEIEIRRIFAPEDFGEAFTPELQKKDQQMRADVERYSLDPPRFENGKEMLIGGLNATYTVETRKDIPAQWHRFDEHMGKIPGQVGAFTYGVSWNYKAGRGFDYLVGVEVSDASRLPKDFVQVRIPAGRYAVFTHRKPIAQFADTFDAIWTKWLPNSDHNAADAPTFERYGDDFDPQKGPVEVWVPLKA